MTSFPIHVREKKVCLPAGHGSTEPAAFSAWSKKENPCASFLQFELPAAPTSVAHQSPSPCPHLHFFQPLLPTGSSLFCRGGVREEAKQCGRNEKAELLPSSRGGGGGVTTV